MEQKNTDVRVPLISKIAYGMGDVGCNFSWMFVGNFLMILACRNSLYCHGIDMAVTEHRLEGQFLIQRKAHGQCHFPALAEIS